MTRAPRRRACGQRPESRPARHGRWPGAPTIGPRSPSCRPRTARVISASSADTSLRCASHCSTSPTSSAVPPFVVALLLDDLHDRVDQGAVALVEHEQHMTVAGLEAAVGFDRVVQAQHRGRGAAVQHAAAGLEPRLERVEAVRGAPFLRRCLVEPEPGAGDDAERALAADEQLGQVGPDRGTGRAAGVDDATVGEHDVETDDDVFDLSVTRRHLPGASAREPAPDGRQVDRLRPVADRHVMLGPEGLLEPCAERARRARRGPSTPCPRR